MTCIKNTKLVDAIDSKTVNLEDKNGHFCHISVILVELTVVSVPDMIDFKLVTC